MKRRRSRIIIGVHASFVTASAVYGQEVTIDPYLELLRSDVKAQKVALITEAMKFSEKDGEKFWHIYREYELELSKVHDSRIKLINRSGWSSNSSVRLAAWLPLFA